MMRFIHRSVLAGLLSAAAVGGCSPAASPAAAPLTEAEVAAFMRDYGTALRTQDREAVVARYDEAGVYMLGPGNKMLMPKDELAAFYRTRWTGPGFFEWMNLSYEIVGPSSAVVAGQFRWADPGSTDTVRFSYASLVRRTPAGLRIRLEDESPEPPASK